MRRGITMILLFLLALLFVSCHTESALVTAIKANDIVRVRTLLEAGADVNAAVDKEQRTALHLAAFWGGPELIDLLLQKGASVSRADAYGRTPLHFAARGNCQNINKLVGSGASVDPYKGQPYYTPLMEAAVAGNAVAVKCLIDLGADLNRQDGSGFTALMQAVWSGNVESVKVLINAGADANQKNNHDDTALDIAQKNGQDEIAQIINTEHK